MSAPVDTSAEAVEALAFDFDNVPPCANNCGCAPACKVRAADSCMCSETAATLRALAAERDVLRAVESNLLAENDALRFHLNNVPLQLAAARREGAEAMRERAARVCEERAQQLAVLLPPERQTDELGARAAIAALETTAAAIRALAVEGESDV